MLPRMTKRSVGQSTVAPRGGRMGVRTGRGGGRTREQPGRCEGAIVYTRWIEKIESVQDMSGCGDNQNVKYTTSSFIEEFYLNNEMQKLVIEFWCHAMAGASHAMYTNQFHELARLVPHLVTPENKRIESIEKNIEKRGNSGESSRDGNVRDDNKIYRTGRAFASVANPVKREYT
ncbi:hypothetical protein Tco_1432934, partial [Tanacetum coccineum]